MTKIVCPYCFDTFKRKDVMFKCSDAHPDFKDKFFWGSLLGRMPNSAKCPKCKKHSYSVVCPICHKRIPKQMVKKKGYIISIIGARNSGKTIYITTLINELFQYIHCLGNIGIIASATVDNNTQSRYVRNFYNKVYKEHRTPSNTDINDSNNNIPLIYELGQKGKSPIYLVFYDTAGENFTDPRNIAANVKFLNQSDAVIFILDTYSIPDVNNKLNLSSHIETRYDVVISNLITHFEEGDNNIRNAHYKKPMALVFTKIDAILNNKKLFMDEEMPGMSLERNSSFLDGSGVNLSDIDSISNGVRSALNSWGEQNFINSIENHYKNVKYFGISALGDNPRGQDIENLRSYRVLDPLVWILHQLKYSLPIVK